MFLSSGLLRAIMWTGVGATVVASFEVMNAFWWALVKGFISWLLDPVMWANLMLRAYGYALSFAVGLLPETVGVTLADARTFLVGSVHLNKLAGIALYVADFFINTDLVVTSIVLLLATLPLFLAIRFIIWVLVKFWGST